MHSTPFKRLLTAALREVDLLPRFLAGARIPYRFKAKCFAALLPVVLLFSLATWGQNIIQLILVASAGLFIVAFSFKRFKVLGRKGADRFEGIPAASRLVRFMNS